MRPRHPKKDIEKALAAAEVAGWSVEKTSGHAWGAMTCPTGEHRAQIWSTPKNPGNFAKKLHRIMAKCARAHQPEAGEPEGELR